MNKLVNNLVFNLKYCLKLFSDLLLSLELPGLVTESKADSFITAASQIERGSFSGSKGLFCLSRSAQAKIMNLDVLCNVCDLCLTIFRYILGHPFNKYMYKVWTVMWPMQASFITFDNIYRELTEMKIKWKTRSFFLVFHTSNFWAWFKVPSTCQTETLMDFLLIWFTKSLPI